MKIVEVFTMYNTLDQKYVLRTEERVKKIRTDEWIWVQRKYSTEKVNPMTKKEWMRKFEKKTQWKRKIENKRKEKNIYVQLKCKEIEINSTIISSIECYKCDTFY